MDQNWTLVLLLLIPLIGAVFCAFLPNDRLARSWALAVSLLTAAIGIWTALNFDFSVTSGIHYEFKGFNFDTINFAFNLSIDTIGLWLILLTVCLTPLAIAASFDSIKERQKEYYAWMLALLVAMNGVFMSRDLLLFYIFFELTLIPMFFIIGIWGGPDRRYAAIKFFLFTFAGSVFTLAAVVYLGVKANTFDIPTIIQQAQILTSTERFWIVLGLLAGFAVKVPLFPVHTWLPLAHTEAPTAGSVILAGVLLKLGTYGLLRLALPIGFIAAEGSPRILSLVHVIGVLCLIGVIYGALVAWVQQDIKKLVAYSSVSHLGFCVLGLVAMNDIGIQGSVMYMINHGLSTGAMFLVIGMIYDRYHTRDINKLSGLGKIMPKMAFFFVLFVMASIGLPGTNGFVSEFLTILGAFTSSYLGITYGVVAAIGIVLGALYMLHMTARVIFGPLKVPGHEGDDHGHGHGHGAADAHGHETHGDLNARELSILIPIAIAVIVLGVMPTPLMRSILAPVQQLRMGGLVAAGPAVGGEKIASKFSPPSVLRVREGAPALVGGTPSPALPRSTEGGSLLAVKSTSVTQGEH